jgi:hypothetical protein
LSSNVRLLGAAAEAGLTLAIPRTGSSSNANAIKNLRIPNLHFLSLRSQFSRPRKHIIFDPANKHPELKKRNINKHSGGRCNIGGAR